MGSATHEDGAVPVNTLPPQQCKGRVTRTFSLLGGAALAFYALSFSSLPTAVCGQASPYHVYGYTDMESEPVAPRVPHLGSVNGNAVRRAQASHLIREMDLTRSNDTREGQPVVAVNPQNPDNMVYVTTRFPPLPSLEPLGGCFLAYSFDRGTTWTNITADYPLGTAPKCGEPQVFASANGTFYILNNQVFSGLEDNMASHPQLSKSVDGGQTWSTPVMTPLYMQGATKLRVDTATGKVYANGASSWEYPAAVSVSSDGGATWAPFNQIPGDISVCLDYGIADLGPICGFPGRSIAVYDGILASAAENPSGNPEMYVSRDDGVTWTTFSLTDSDGNPVANGTGPMLPVSGVGLPSDPTPWVAADPTKTGRFALMVPREYTLEIYVTENAGENFTGPAVIETPDAHRPAMDFGWGGELGVMWRTNTSGFVDAYTTVSFDSGRTFGEPIKITNASEPISQTGQPGDRASFIAITDKYAYITWSDGRDGLLDGMLAEVPLEVYKNTTKGSL